MSTAPLELPRQFGNYTLLKMLARGGMGEIYLARTVGLTGFEKYYAVKKLLRKFTSDNDVGARFVDEAKLGARLQHPNIVQVYDLGKVSEELFMATEFVDGFDLRRVLRFCHEKKKRIPLDIALFIVREILSGLAYAHRQVDAEGALINLIHRDISPQNVLVSFEGEVKIIDFGLAKSTQRSQETQANVLLGNFGYMSPEQARGQILDPRTDVYSCGIVLFELVTGTKRFVEENPLKLLEMVARPTAIVPSDRVPGIPKAVDRIYEKATAQDRDARHESAEAFRDDVTAALHRLNPRASRENLAQFLNHLFLGGQAPPTVDNDVLNKSVVLMARDLHAGADAFAGSAADDVRNRALSSGFADNAPQTASLPLLRSARVGDVLTHEALTGEPELPQVVDLADLQLLDPVPLDASFDPLAGQPRRGAPTAVPDSERRSAVVLQPLAEDITLDRDFARPTGVYDSPSWPSNRHETSEERPEQTEIRGRGPSSSELEVQRQLDEQMQVAEAQAALQRQLEAQALHAQREAQLQAQMQMQMQMEQARMAEAQRQLEAQREAYLQAQRQAQAEEQARQAAQRHFEHQARQQALQAQLAEQQTALRQPDPRRRRAESTEVPTGPRRSPTLPPGEIPSVVISPELGGDDATVRNPRAPAQGSPLFIDLDSSSSDDDALPLVQGHEEPRPPIARPPSRPALTPAPTMRPRRVSDEGPPTTMPPPTRRR